MKFTWIAKLNAEFVYGNYDGISGPPRFMVEIDGNLWANVMTSMSPEEPLYYEVIYWTIQKTTNSAFSAY